VLLRDPAKGGSDKDTTCFEMKMPEDFFTEDHDSFIFMAAFSGQGVANEHLLHRVRFRDTRHLHDTEEVDTDADREAFTGKQKDILRKGALKQDD
jgi:hypothetical protein